MRVSIATYVALQGLHWGDSGAWHLPALSSPEAWDEALRWCFGHCSSAGSLQKWCYDWCHLQAVAEAAGACHTALHDDQEGRWQGEKLATSWALFPLALLLLSLKGCIWQHPDGSPWQQEAAQRIRAMLGHLLWRQGLEQERKRKQGKKRGKSGLRKKVCCERGQCNDRGGSHFHWTSSQDKVVMKENKPTAGLAGKP